MPDYAYNRHHPHLLSAHHQGKASFEISVRPPKSSLAKAEEVQKHINYA